MIVSIPEHTGSADYHIYFILSVRLLGVVPDRPVNFQRHGAVAEEFEEGFTFAGTKQVRCFLYGNFHER